MQQFASSAKDYLVRKRKIILLMMIVVVATLLLSSLISVLLESNYSVNLPSVGNIRTIGVEAYMDEQLENKSYDITWGTVYPGSVVNATRYVLSISNEEITLNMTVEDWQYHNSSGIVSNETAYINLNWNSEGNVLKPGQHAIVVFTLNVSLSLDFINFVIKNQVESFSFDLRISPKELIATG